jgi:tRNA G18 (ribose-2'-O)-methylase SpoU
MRATQPAKPPATLAETLEHLGSLGISLIAAHPHAEGKTLPEADFRSDSCLLFGSEGYGIARPLLDLCHEAVAIPMSCGIDSLNVATAAAVFFYEVHRQRAVLA